MDVERGHMRECLDVGRACIHRLLNISPSTMDRFRGMEHRPVVGRRGGTKPGALLKCRIQVRTSADWDDERPGFEEIGLAQHHGGNPSGLIACALDVTDASTGWTEMQAVPTKAQTHVLAALPQVRAEFPFPLFGLGSDNGAEFIDDELLRYCRRERLTFTRARVRRKNDNPFIEQMNWFVVRRLVGYGYCEIQRQVNQLNAPYAVYRLCVNRLLPMQKRVTKVREGNEVKKLYDDRPSPYQRVLDLDPVSPEARGILRTPHAKLDVVGLKRQLGELLEQIPSRQR